MIYFSAPFYGRPENIKMTANLHAALMNVGIRDITTASGRYSDHWATLGFSAHQSGE
jgi:hypothetical protein